MCKKYIYLRVSTDKQTFEQQMQDIKAYGVNPDEVDGIVEEHESGGKSYTDRKFQELLNKCESGDVIYAASTDRLGRSFSDMIRLMADAKTRGITIVACKQGLKLDDDSLATKMLLTIMALVDEDERMRIKHRTKNKLEWKKQQIAEKGYFVVEKGVNAGLRKTHLGQPKGYQPVAASEAAAVAKQEALIRWRETSPAYAWVRQQVLKGKARNTIIEEFNELHTQQPDVYCTREGAKLSKGVLSKWIRQMGLN